MPYEEVNIISRGNLQGNVTVQGTDEITVSEVDWNI